MIPIGEGGTQLYPGGPGRYPQSFSTGCRPPPAGAVSGRVRSNTFACTTYRSDIRQVYETGST